MSSSWRDLILDEFIPNVSKLTLVADPDTLLTEEKLLLELRQRGFDLIEFSDPIEFRFAYESKYRAIWDRGEHTDLVVVLRLQDAELEALPYDLLQAGRRLSFNLGEIFPNLSYPVVEQLDRSLLDALFLAQSKAQPDRMGDNASRDFILRHVFSIAAELIASDVELLRMLLRLHYGQQPLPFMLAERLTQSLEANKSFSDWPLADIVADDSAFFAFLQERWPIFLSKYSESIAQENPKGYSHHRIELQTESLQFSGPTFLPFDHQDIKVYIDNLFLEGKLAPVKTTVVSVKAQPWMRAGIITQSGEDQALRIARLFELLKQDQPNAQARYTDWTAFALKWAELSALVYCSNHLDHLSQLKKLGDIVNSHFAVWLADHYASLINLPPANTAMLHHIPRLMAREIEDDTSKRVALIVVDGLALDQWVTVRQILQNQCADLIIRESATFAWVPTLTSVSRQSLFSAKAPFYFPASINSTHKEEKLWRQFWEDYPVSRLDVVYQRGLGDTKASNVLDSLLNPGKTRVVGLVIDKVDKIMHGMQLGSAGMHNQVTQWCQEGFLIEMLNQLLTMGYQVWLTSDHGNIQCEGKGRPAEGVIAETRGERARVYPSQELREQVAVNFPFANQWQPIGLPPEYFPLLATGRDAFINQGETVVGHGGIAIEEVIVPLIKFEKRMR